MKFTITVQELQDVVSRLQGTSTSSLNESPDSTMSQLSSFLFHVSDDGAMSALSTNNFQQQVWSLAPKELKDPKSFTIPSSIVNICSTLPGDTELVFETDGDKCFLKCAAAEYELNSALNPNEYPQMAEISADKKVTLTASTLKFLLDQTAFSAARNDPREYLNGVLMEAKDKTVSCVATNGHRLAACEMKSDSPGVENEMKVVLPNKFVEELLKLLEHSDEKIDFYFGDRSAKVETKQFSLSSVLHEGKYPDWRKVVPEGNNNKVEVKKEDFVHGLARAMAISTDQQEAITLFNEDGDLHLKTKNSITNDEANAKVPLAKKADEFKIAFNAKYLSDAVNKVDSDTVVFEIKDSTTAIKMYGDSAKETTFIIMPMKL